MTALFNPAVQSDLRFRSRHTHKTIAAYIEEKFGELGWVTAPINFGTDAVTFEEIAPDENGKAVKPNTVSIAIGDVAVDELYELGGGLYHFAVPVFFDVYGVNASVAQSIADDIREQVTREQIIPVYDWTLATAPVKTTSTIEFENVVGPEKPQVAAASADFKRYWRVVKAEAHVYYHPTY
jgi:hypothetical protein